MTVLLWPQTENRGVPEPASKAAGDRLPASILDIFAAGIPGRKNESEAERVARIAMWRAEILRYNPRDAVEAMRATRCIIYGIMLADLRRYTSTSPRTAAYVNKFLRDSKQLLQQATATRRILAERQSSPFAEIDNAVFEALGLSQPPIPEPDDSGSVEEAFSAVIVPLHSAPKMLQ